MDYLRLEYLTDLFVLVDDLLPMELPRRGRPANLQPSELVTALIWNSLTAHSQTLREVYDGLWLYHRREFPSLPSYSAFVAECHQVLPALVLTLQSLLLPDTTIQFVDSTMLEVCTTRRAADYRVARGVAAFGKNHQGWHFGFKLHAAVDTRGRLCGLVFTPANEADVQQLPHLIKGSRKLAVGDTGYNSTAMRRSLWDEYQIYILAPPWPNQRTQLLTQWQRTLLSWRSKIEAVFDQLKEHRHLQSSFPRSPLGYLLHYVRILLGYQVAALMG